MPRTKYPIYYHCGRSGLIPDLRRVRTKNIIVSSLSGRTFIGIVLLRGTRSKPGRLAYGSQGVPALLLGAATWRYVRRIDPKDSFRIVLKSSECCGSRKLGGIDQLSSAAKRKFICKRQLQAFTDPHFFKCRQKAKLARIENAHNLPFFGHCELRKLRHFP
jgi:hypothetical protein